MSETLTLESLAERWDTEVIPETERFPKTSRQEIWSQVGMVIDEGLVDEDSMLDYEREWLRCNGGPDAVLGDKSTYASPGGWDYATPYMDHPALLALACSPRLAEALEELTGEPMGVHLNLTCWMSTTRRWHQDEFLNEPYVGGFYAAVWLALDDVHPDSGPFEFIAGSHRDLPPLSQRKVRTALGGDGDRPDWPTQSERVVTPLYEEWIAGRKINQFIARRGESLIWHSCLLHQGSIPKDPSLERRGVILHFSGIHHRPDFPPAVEHHLGGHYFPIVGRQPLGLRED